ncbi:MAG: FMN-binding negative transcriptional regulator, partial [Deefgea sp.]
PPHFVEKDSANLLHLMANNPLATLVQTTEEGLTANLIPLYWYDDGSELGVLRGHVARKNPLWKESDSAILALFRAGDEYISPSYFPSKAKDPRVVPTWNYAVVQVKGTLRAIEDADWLLSLLNQMTAQHEAGRVERWQIADAPAEYIQKMLAAIVGIEIAITALDGKFKLSQNQTAENQAGVAANTKSLDLVAFMQR